MGSSLKVRFKTDGSVKRDGFVLELWTACGGYLTGSRGIISSPNYPMNYPPNSDCVWRVGVREGSRLQFRVSSLNIFSEDVACHQDYLMLRNGISNASPLMLINRRQGDNQNGRVCLNGLSSEPVNTTSNHLYVNFHSDGNEERSGFMMRYRELDNACGGHFSLQEGDLNDFSLLTPNFPDTPPPRSECEWVITAPRGQRIRIDFNDRFDLVSSRE